MPSDGATVAPDAVSLSYKQWVRKKEKPLFSSHIYNMRKVVVVASHVAFMW